jgi:hypothetical protein
VRMLPRFIEISPVRARPSVTEMEKEKRGRSDIRGALAAKPRKRNGE